jgi:uncharacterized caspase-like protein
VQQTRRFEPLVTARKQALVIGNASYPRSPLKNPVNDALAMQATLQSLGFQVVMKENLDFQGMESTIDDFISHLTAESFAFVYFSGHGAQVNSENYLLPVDFHGSSEADVSIRRIPLQICRKSWNGVAPNCE